MKRLFTFISIFSFSISSYSQTNSIVISTDGIDSIKIGMSRKHVEAVTATKLKPYLQLDSVLNPFIQYSRENKYYECDYKGLKLLLTFWWGSRLDIISTLPGLSIIETKTGIRVGTCQSEFDEICASTKSYCSYLTTKEGCFISDEKEGREQNSMFVMFKNSIVATIGVRRMVGD